MRRKDTLKIVSHELRKNDYEINVIFAAFF